MGGTAGYPPTLVNQIETIAHKQYPRATHNTISRGQNMGSCRKDDDLVKDALILGAIMHIGHMDDVGDNDTFDSDTFDDTFDDGDFE